MPDRVRGSELQMRIIVDSAGHVVADSTVFCGARDGAYAIRFARVVAAAPFEPARREGIAIQSVYFLLYRF